MSVPLIVGAVYACLQLLKKIVKSNEKVLKIFPLIAAGLGAVLGIVAFFALPEIIPASNIFLALLIGGSSGLAATGTHQVFKQLLPKLTELTKKKEEGKTDDGTGKTE